MDDLYEIKLFDPGQVIFSRKNDGVLQGVIENTVHEELKVVRTFPFSRPFEYLSVRNPKGEEIGIIKRLDDLDPESAREIRRELSLRYIVPVVKSIESIRREGSVWMWKMETDMGPVKMFMGNLNDFIQILPGSSVLVSDMEGRRCEIKNVRELDAHSQRQLGRIM